MWREILLSEIFVYRVVVGGERYSVATYANEELAQAELKRLQDHLRAFVFPEDSLLLLEVWKLNTFLDSDTCEVVQSYPLKP